MTSSRHHAAIGQLSLAMSLIASLFLASSALADGVLYGKGGRLVQEEQQHAFIEWEDGQERLYVATHFTANSEPTLWLLPIPSDPQKVIADPVDTIPRVMAEYPAVNKARQQLHHTIWATVILDGAPLTLPFGGIFLIQTLGTNASAVFKNAQDVEVHRHVEEFGMVVEVLTAKSTGGLEEYLRSKEIDLRAVDMASLKPYLETDCALVCGWSASTSEAPDARALRIDFPSPQVFYPLLPTSAYELPLESSVYVRGAFQLVAGSEVAARCQFVWADVQESRAGQHLNPFFDAKPQSMNALLTRVVLPRSPKEWTDDLRLEPADSAALKAADGIERLGYLFTFLLQAGVGATLGLLLPFLTVPREERRATDFLWGFWTGAAICLSLIASAVLFREWRLFTFSRSKQRLTEWRDLKQALRMAAVAPLVFAVAALLTALLWTLLVGSTSSVAPLVAGAIVVAVLLLIGGTQKLPISGESGDVARWLENPWRALIGFAMAHCVLVSTICLALHVWFARY